MATVLCKCPVLWRPSLSVLAALHGCSGRLSQGSLSPSYVYHPKKQTIEADLQGFLWTKTQRVQKPPNIVSKLKDGLKTEPFLRLMVEHVILASRVYETQEVKMKHKNKPKDLTRGAHKNFPASFIQNLLRLVLSQAHSYPQVRDISVSLEPYVSASWPCMDNVVTVRGKPDMVLNRRNPLAQFYDTSIIKQSSEFNFESQGLVSPFLDLQKYSVTNRTSTGFSEGLRVFPHPHTVFIIDNGEYSAPPSKGWPEIQLLQKGLVFTFGRLYAQAVSKYGHKMIGYDLPQPLAAQCVVTDGCRFSFLWYQLNTLNTQDPNDDGMKNLVCIERPGLLYSSLESDGLFRKTLVDLNQDILRSLLAVYLLE